MINLKLKREFSQGDIVYCPFISKQALVVFTKEGVNGIFLRNRNKEFWFTISGLPEQSLQINNSSALRAPMVYEATEHSTYLLNQLVGGPFILNPHIPIFVLGHSDMYRCKKQTRSNYISPENVKLFSLIDMDILITPDAEYLEGIRRGSETVICVGKYDIRELRKRGILTK